MHMICCCSQIKKHTLKKIHNTTKQYKWNETAINSHRLHNEKNYVKCGLFRNKGLQKWLILIYCYYSIPIDCIPLYFCYFLKSPE